MKNILLLTLFLFSVDVLAKGKECFYVHIEDAIKENKRRRELYSKLTDKKPRRVSNELIFGEEMSLFTARYFDKKARYFHKKDVQFLCYDFIDMKYTPEFVEYKTPLNTIDEFSDYNPQGLQKKMKFLIKRRDYKRLGKLLYFEIKKLEKIPTYHCMLRHVFESMLRSVNLIPHYKKKLSRKDWRKLDKLINDLLKIKNMTLFSVIRLDKLAAPIQAEGIPIICNDIPAIPYNLEDLDL